MSTSVGLRKRNCSHWVEQLQSLFPQTETPVTVEFIQAMGDLMALYSEKAISEVCHPVTGISTKQKYLPSLFDLKKALNEAAEPEIREVREAKLADERHIDREAEVRLAVERATRPSYDQLMSSVPDALKIVPKLTVMTPEMFIEKHPGVTKEQLDAIPDLPQRHTGPIGRLDGNPANRPSYTGPMKDIRPGDVLHCSRFDEYREYMRVSKGLPNVKLWGVNEKEVDSGMRPFSLATNPVGASINTKPSPNKAAKEVVPEEANPFD